MSATFSERPADVLNIGFMLFLSGVTILYRDRVDGPGVLLGIYSLLIVVQVLIMLPRKKKGAFRVVYDLVFPTLSILAAFDTLERIVHRINPVDLDPRLIRADYALFGAYPTVALEAVIWPPLTDLLQLAYSSYYFLPVVLGVSLKMRGEARDFDRALFFIMLCFYLSYVGYLLWPALGPRFAMNHLQTRELMGCLVTEPLQDLLNRLEGVKRDAFPSGHTGIALTVLYLAVRHNRRLAAYLAPCVAGLVFATVYCRYHYVVDVIAGVLLTLLTVVLGELLYGCGKQRIDHHS